MTQFFDVYADRILIDDADQAGYDFVMRAPMTTLRAVYSLHKIACERVVRNADKATILHGNGKRANLLVVPIEWDAPRPTCTVGV